MVMHEYIGAPEVVYHYTTAAGLHGIVSNITLWASDASFLNDAQELTYSHDYLLAELQKSVQWLERHRAPRPIGGGAGADHDELVDVFNAIIAELDQAVTLSPEQLHVYVTCFCNSGDLLSQWRGYGGAGGFALGIQAEALYDLSKQKAREGLFDKVCYGIDEGIERGWIDRWPPNRTPQYSITNALAMIKHPAFREEQEWRLMIPDRGTRDDLRFRVGPIGLIPYLQLDLPVDAVKRVIVGPGRHIGERISGVRQLLDRFGLNDVPVEPSKAPLR
ncbi:DUF2971 domain-containing protein (plasmid) [Streptomyces sp. NBC_01717]|uniref:DUF2971 domain-containing protein n=1 Tax=Streptomyces sp. NBC_01717 TaxID=2975918 RepID=UPI002E3393B0|nr:DUF2971 domain-containing protein [Streptomyces sp. NBC_01717]